MGQGKCSLVTQHIFSSFRLLSSPTQKIRISGIGKDGTRDFPYTRRATRDISATKKEKLNPDLDRIRCNKKVRKMKKKSIRRFLSFFVFPSLSSNCSPRRFQGDGRRRRRAAEMLIYGQRGRILAKEKKIISWVFLPQSKKESREIFFSGDIIFFEYNLYKWCGIVKKFGLGFYQLTERRPTLRVGEYFWA